MRKFLQSHFILPVTALYLYLAGSAPFLGQWDSFDYLKQIVSHRLSDLGIGRPVFLGYNILLWETMRKIFKLDPLSVEKVIMAGAVLLGVFGVLLFQRLARQMLRDPASRMAALALAVSPVYAIYSGFIMTEVPMLVALTASALLLWKPGGTGRTWRDISAGILFGLAVGIREQAITLGAAYLWIVLSRESPRSGRLRSVLSFGLAAFAAVVTPAIAMFLLDPAGFVARTKTWLHAIPMDAVQFRNNMEASLLFTFIVCPGSWLAVAGAGIGRIFGKAAPKASEDRSPELKIPNPVWGIICCLVLPLAVLWRDADVQMHPRYTLIVLPASLILCVSLYRRWLPARRRLAAWAVVHVLVFGVALAAFSPYRQSQIAKMEFARSIRESVPDAGLIIAGNCSPILDYYRGIGERPRWQILWAGWDWDAGTVAARVSKAWADGVPVYWGTYPAGWSYFERELLETHFLFQNCRKKLIAPNIYQVYGFR
jgi:hypothetical protein